MLARGMLLRSARTRTASLAPLVTVRSSSDYHRREECVSRLEKMKAEGRNALKPLKTKQKGIDILHDPLWNKGMAMDYPERDRLNLRGLIPPRVKNLSMQANRIMMHLRAFGDDNIAKNMYLQELHNRNETLYHRVVPSRRELSARAARAVATALRRQEVRTLDSRWALAARGQHRRSGSARVHADRWRGVPALWRPVPPLTRHVLQPRGPRCRRTCHTPHATCHTPHASRHTHTFHTTHARQRTRHNNNNNKQYACPHQQKNMHGHVASHGHGVCQASSHRWCGTGRTTTCTSSA
jgi:hypothetical protein